ncbi:nervous system development [Seminavis robusta]|uniref:Nervous system development n=1 Tax=Seminavis robusta TaxID=568900 RepID=A0A9N8F1R3_9STRA|nr:nervous system development [Seminavis robusta]|eukprot:Sro2572_g331630.1 nervous system development (462) ;mRNA; f:6973-8358
MASAEEETTKQNGRCEEASSSKAKRFRISEEGPPPSKDKNPGQTWRGDPKETFSDWKIIVVSKTPDSEEAQATTYHVHKFMLTCGGRNSKYFAKLFQNTSNFREGESCTTQLELDPLAMTAFPALLDYLYDEYKPLHIDTKTATALHYLGEYLDIHRLRWDALQFCKKNLSLDNADIYYEHAMTFQNESILGILAKFLGEKILHISPEAKILQTSSPDLWVNALEHISKNESTSRHISKLVAKFAQNNPDALDLETFQSLTSLEITPQIEWNAALTLCVLEDKAAKESTKELSQLQERCSDSLAQNWESFLLTDDATTKLLRERKPDFLVDLLLKSLKDAASKLTEYRAALSSTRQELAQTNSTLQSTDASLSSTQDTLNSTTREMSLVKAELQKFTPVSSNSGGWRSPQAVPDSLCNVNPSLQGRSTSQYCRQPSTYRTGYGGASINSSSNTHYVFLYQE